jgi:DNA-binding LacI/PurR family transcriptional regulator
VPVTIADVARHAGVGRGTVSRVLNDHPNVDPATRARVRAAIDELAFVPSNAARRLSLGRSRQVAVAVVLDDRPRTLAILRGIDRVLAGAGLDLLLVDVSAPGRRAAFADLVSARGRVDGALLAGIVPTDPEAEALVSSGVPVIVVDAVHEAFASVAADPGPGSEDAAERAAAIGARRLLDAMATRGRTDRRADPGEPDDEDGPATPA